MEDVVYLDNAATTPLLDSVRDAMVDALAHTFGNPANASHRIGREAAAAIELAREQLGTLVGAPAERLVLTSGSTEANNLAIRGVLAASRGRRVIVACEIEHRSVLAPADELAREQGLEVRRVAVDRTGVLDLAALDAALDEDVLLVCVHLANNEIGTVQPLGDVVERAHRVGAYVLCDATQAIGKLPVDCAALEVDLLSLSAHKFHGPKGAGALYVRDRSCLAPLLTGGGQEHGMRAGTPNVPAIVGMGVAASEARRHLADGVPARVRARRERIESALLEACPDARVNGADAPRLPGICSITVPGRCGAQLVQSLPELAISRGSACSTGSPTPSHVLTALGWSEADAFATLRVSLGALTTDDDVDRSIAAIGRVLAEAAA
jgi:cysteine desulfurase